RQEGTDADVGRYVAKRLAGVARSTMDAVKIGAAVLELAPEAHEGLFLLVRFTTAQLRAEPIDTSQPGWQALLSHGVEAAFERDIARLPPMQRDGLEIPQAARELLTALAWSYGDRKSVV